ncbi:MAG: hypothetical protein KAU16_01830 [Methanophagales archaeon]|nr:hypothetical protein [Methanophagales archaeon]
MSEEKTFIKVSGACKEFDGKEVLKEVSVDIKEGEPRGLLGRSGGGEISFASHVDAPSKVGEVCSKCGAKLELRELNYWEDKDVLKEFMEERR